MTGEITRDAGITLLGDMKTADWTTSCSYQELDICSKVRDQVMSLQKKNFERVYGTWYKFMLNLLVKIFW